MLLVIVVPAVFLVTGLVLMFIKPTGATGIAGWCCFIALALTLVAFSSRLGALLDEISAQSQMLVKRGRGDDDTPLKNRVRTLRGPQFMPRLIRTFCAVLIIFCIVQIVILANS